MEEDIWDKKDEPNPGKARDPVEFSCIVAVAAGEFNWNSAPHVIPQLRGALTFTTETRRFTEILGLLSEVSLSSESPWGEDARSSLHPTPFN